MSRPILCLVCVPVLLAVLVAGHFREHVVTSAVAPEAGCSKLGWAAEIMLVVDVSASARYRLQQFKRQFHGIAQDLKREFGSLRLGLVSFSDKNFGREGYQMDVCFKLNHRLTHNLDAVELEVTDLEMLSGADLPESQNDALFYSLRYKEVGWSWGNYTMPHPRRPILKLVVMLTDYESNRVEDHESWWGWQAWTEDETPPCESTRHVSDSMVAESFKRTGARAAFLVSNITAAEVAYTHWNTFLKSYSVPGAVDKLKEDWSNFHETVIKAVSTAACVAARPIETFPDEQKIKPVVSGSGVEQIDVSIPPKAEEDVAGPEDHGSVMSNERSTVTHSLPESTVQDPQQEEGNQDGKVHGVTGDGMTQEVDSPVPPRPTFRPSEEENDVEASVITTSGIGETDVDEGGSVVAPAATSESSDTEDSVEDLGLATHLTTPITVPAYHTSTTEESSSSMGLPIGLGLGIGALSIGGVVAAVSYFGKSDSSIEDSAVVCEAEAEVEYRDKEVLATIGADFYSASPNP